MKFKDYLKDKLFMVMAAIICFGLSALMFAAFRIQSDMAIVILGIWAVFVMTILLWDYFRKKKFYDELLTNLERLDKKYLVLETLESPSFYDGELLVQVLYDIDKSMCENVREYSKSIEEFKDYIEMWVHEIKLPIASLQLMCHNNKNILDKKYLEQIRRMDNYADQILYYVRSEHAENDYLIKETELGKIVTKAAVHNKDDLLACNINFNVENIDCMVYTDAKWFEFILNQLISNSIKYRQQDDLEYQPCIKLSACDCGDKIELHIWDNGIGIPAQDLPKVFQKAFTGENGRIGAKSTGMGLYIVHRLCRKLGHTVDIVSKQGEYTEIIIGFGKNDFMKPQ